jgi:HTH domain
MSSSSGGYTAVPGNTTVSLGPARLGQRCLSARARTCPARAVPQHPGKGVAAGGFRRGVSKRTLPRTLVQKSSWYASPPVILKSCTIVQSLTIEKKGNYMPYRGDLTYRLVELQLMLAERPRSQQELVQHFRVNRKTIRKDIDALSGHHPITEERAGRHVMYRFIDGFRFQPPQFTPSELATLLLAQDAIAITGQNTVTSPFATHARTLMGKVRAALPEYARQRLDVLAHVFGSAATPVKDFTSHAATIELLIRSSAMIIGAVK